MATATVIAGLGTALSVASSVVNTLGLEDTLMTGAKELVKGEVKTALDEISHFAQAPASAYSELKSRLTDSDFKSSKSPYHINWKK